MDDSVSAAVVDPRRRTIGTVDTSFYIIGIGASAGGLDAIRQLISQVPADFPHSLVIVQHISPDYKSMMPEILARETSLRISQVSDGMAVKPSQIYLIPPRSNIVIQGTSDDDQPGPGRVGDDATHDGLRFSLVEPASRPAVNLPIDIFFHSLAEAVQDRSVAIVLSGTGTDGSRGLRAIRDREGFVMVQEPNTAAFDGMPKAAIGTGIVDVVVAPDMMVSELNRYFELRAHGISNVMNLFRETEQEFDRIVKLVSAKADIDFQQYKKPTLQRRVARRMAFRGVTSPSSYLEKLDGDSAEINTLHREFLVGVTNFFRDLPVWNALIETVLPGLFSGGNLDEPVKVWSAGCSTGEEAFTIAILLERYRREHDIARDYRIYATDVKADAINIAKQGTYADGVRDEMPHEILESDLVQFRSGTCRISSSVRNKVFFAVHNIVDDVPYTRTDLVICRNLLIYLSPDVQTKVMTHFSFSLRQDGFLLLGAAESPGQHGAMFEPVLQKSRIYRNTRHVGAHMRRTKLALDFPITRILPRNTDAATRLNRRPDDTGKLLHASLVDAGVCVCIVSEDGRMIRTFGEHERLLRISSDGFSPNLLDLVDEQLRSAMAMMMRRADIDGHAEKTHIRVGGDFISASCRKIEWDNHPVAFSITLRHPIKTDEDHSDEPPTSANARATNSHYARQLESEVESLQAMLSATAEDLGASNEELQTTNEELIASNEELQANNEETQSINEELYTVNAENVERIAELEAATADINNLLATADLGILVLSDDLRIRQFSHGIALYFELQEGDIGRPINNFSSKLTNAGLMNVMDDVERARDHGAQNIREVQRTDGGWARTGVRPYRDADNSARGVVVTFLDITETKQLAHEVETQRDRLEGLLESEAAGYWDWDVEAGTEYLSPRFKSMFGYAEHEMENTPEAWQEIIHPDDLPGTLEMFEAHVESRGEIPYDREVRYRHKDGSIIWVLCRGRVVEWDEEHRPLRMMGMHLDITSLKKREQEIQRRAEEIRRFAFIAAHDLIQPINTFENSLSMLIEDLPASDTPDQDQLIHFLTVSAQRMKSRIGGILEYSRMQDGTLELQRVDMDKVVARVLGDCVSQIEEAGAQIHVDALPMCLGAASLLARVFQNLISNSLKYRDNSRDCSVRITEAPAPEGMVGYAVTDNGIGVPSKYKDKVFELFSRLHTEKEFEGNGLGLALCERIVARHGGQITMVEQDQDGARFVFTLKAAPT
ncbi:MAG: chemotaxis protein CheB [Pseudomonadota bacterium]